MTTNFYKYQGTGNDFILIDNRNKTFNRSDQKDIAFLCDRRFGIGADGLILLETHPTCDFKMVYYNSDGNESSMCGNGGRCITAFAHFLGIIHDKAEFEAIDGLHKAEINGDQVSLQMGDVSEVAREDAFVFLDTGSPHHVQLANNVNDLDVKRLGHDIRYSDHYKAEGTNVNFVEPLSSDSFKVRTYERGVEDETLSCGTGVTAVALAMNYIGETEKNLITLHTPGGILKVRFKKIGNTFSDIWLIGPAKQVFKGSII